MKIEIPPSGLWLAGSTNAMPGVSVTCWTIAGTAARGGVGRRVDHDHERPVDAGAEAVGEPVVGAAGGGADGIVARVGNRQPHAECGQCESDEHAAADAPRCAADGG